jgi:hypothetical protein
MKLEHIFAKAIEGMVVSSPSNPDVKFKAVANPFTGEIDWLRYYKDGIDTPRSALWDAKDFRRDDYVVQL